MKTQIKRFSKSTLAVVLTLCMIISCMTVGLIATDAAKVSENSAVAATADSETVGTTYYLLCSYNQQDPVNWSDNDSYATSSDYSFSITPSSFGQSSWANNTNYYVGVSSSSTYTDMYGQNGTVTVTKGTGMNSAEPQKHGNYHFMRFTPSVTGTETIYVNCTVNGTTVTYDISTTSSGGDTPTPSGGTTTDTVNQTSGKTILVSWDTNTSYVWDYVYFYSGYSSTSHNEMSAPVSPNPTATYPQVYYKTLYDSGTGTTAIKFILEEDGSFDGQSANIEPSGFTKGKQWYTIRSSTGHSGKPSPDSNGEYTALKLSSITAPSTLIKDTENSLTVSVDGGLPWFLSSKRSVNTGKYKLTVTDNGTQIFTKDDVLYATKSFTVPWTPSTGGSHTLVYTLTDGIDTVTYSKAYTVIVPETKHAVTFTASPSVGGTITPASGTEVGESTPTTIIATPKAAYTFNGWTFGDGIIGASTSDATTTIKTKSSGDYTVTANFTKKPTHTVTVVSNNNALGTATASVTEAYEGQEVTLTPKEDTGSFSSWSVTSGGVSVSNNKFTMGSSDVSITANFDEYSSENTSEWYYNGYDNNANEMTSQNTPVTGTSFYAQRMTEAKINGVKYSYYSVSGRNTGNFNNHLFSITKNSPADGGRWIFFETPNKSWDDGHGWKSDPQAQFYYSDKTIAKGWTKLEFDKWTGNENDSNKIWKSQIPYGARYVQFRGTENDGSNWPYTGYINLAEWFAGNNNCVYLNSSTTTSGEYRDYAYKKVGDSYPTGNFYEYMYGDSGIAYSNICSTGGFTNHNVNTVKGINNNTRNFNKPNGLGDSANGYYVLVLYKNHAYTINGIETGTLSKDTVIWLPELPDSADTIKVYAKDGAIRDGLNTFANIADTTVYKADGTTSAGATSYGSGQTYEVYKAQRGETIVVKTTIADTACTGASDTYRERYYVRGFCVNGEVPQTLSHNNDGVYTLTYTVPEDYESKYIEITPIYFLKDTTNYPVVTFRATDFPKNQHNWGNVPYCYPFYGNLSDKDNAFGAYPGQPLVFYKGQYSMQVPVKSTSPFSTAGVNTNVAGITMSNGYYDSIHKMIMGYGDNNTSADHVQTYDYGDFWKIFNEKKPVDNIVFDFKYRNVKHNLIDDTTGDSIAASALTDKYTNGFELLKNFHGRNVDLFGTPLSGDAADPSKTPAVYVVSIGGINDNVSGVENIAGYYATEWRVYAPNNKTSTSTTYKKMSAGSKSSIPPEVLVLNDDDDASFNTSTYPSAVDKESKSYIITDWKALYHALEDYRGLPVYISYEAADAQEGAEDYQTGTHGATRNDGRWLYSKNGESITSNIKIQYSDDNGVSYVDNPASGEENYVDGLSAYFTNTDVYGTQTYATTIDPDKTFNFEAKTTNGQYKFVGWYLDDSNKTLITSDNVGSTERSGSYTFIAKFMKVTSGQLILSHSVDTGTVGSTNYDGAGTVTIAAVVKDGDGATVKTFAPTTSDITLDNKIIKSTNTDYTVDVTLTATRGNNSALGTTILATPSGQESKFFDYGDFTVSTDGKTRTYNFAFTVGDLYSGTTQTYMNLIYHSYFKNYVFKYTVNYEFTGRDGGDKIYNRSGTLTAAQAEAYVFKDTMTGTSGDSTEMRFLRKEFFESLAPYESNFQQSLTWNFINKQFTDGTNYVYNCNAHFEAIQNDSNEKVNVTFVLPYAHTNGVATLNNGVGTAATSTNYALINDGENDNRVSFGTIPTLTDDRTNGIYTDAEKVHWIAAPAKLSDGTFFSHWSIKTTDSDVEVARCYFPGFNFLAYDNYVIEAVYGPAASSISASGINTSVTYLSTTRNQWNALAASDAAVPSVDKSDRTNAADVLYNDFVLSYNYNGADIYLNGSDASDIEELGVVVERVKELDKNSDNSYDTRISSYTSLAENAANVAAAINTPVDQNGKATYKDESLQYYKQAIGKNQLDNKNRIQFYEAFFNASGWNSTKQKPQTGYTYKKYVYRAYSYMKLSNGNIVKSATPAYFTMYDVATASYSSN